MGCSANHNFKRPRKKVPKILIAGQAGEWLVIEKKAIDHFIFKKVREIPGTVECFF